MKTKNIGLFLGGVLLAIACGDSERNTPPIRCDAGGCPSGGSGGAGGTGAASGQGGSGATSGRGGASGSSGAAGTGTSGSGGTTSTDAGGQAGSSSAGSGGMNGSGGSGARDAAPDVRSDANDAAADATRRCLEPTRVQDGGSCTVAICRRGATIEMSVSRPEGWVVGALFWVLTVCDIQYFQSRTPAGNSRTLIYDVPEADWTRMREGDPVFMYYGTPGTSSAATPCGNLTKSIQNCAP